MSAGGTILLAGLGGVAGAYAGPVVADAFHLRGGSVNQAAVGSAVGAALATFIGLTTTAVDKQQQPGSLSGPPPPLRFP